MELLENKWKCGLYFLAVISVFGVLGVSYRVRPTHIQYAYKYEFDSKSICQYLEEHNFICTSSNVTDAKSCLDDLRDQERCQALVNAWAEAFNGECQEYIFNYAKCDLPTDCSSFFALIIECEKSVNKPEWLPLPNINEDKT